MSLNGARLTWFGHATWLLETPGGKRVLLDPWFTGNPKAPENPDLGRIDVILLSHGHSDHTADLVRLSKEKQPKAVVGMIELMDYFEGQGVENGVGMNKGGSTEVEGLRITLTHAHHSSSFGEADGTIVYTGEPAGIIVTLENGFKLYFAGDTTVFGDMALIGELYAPDVAMLPIGDFFTMGPFEAAKAVELLGVKKVVPMHWGTFPLLPGTPDALREELAKRGLDDVEVLDTEPGGGTIE
jgi:L-ascorbate metabolism protein UlaG (beta-lactamase superfamily)